MTVEELYDDCKEQLKALGVELHGRHTGGFDGYYKGKHIKKHILRVAKIEHQGLTIDVTMTDYLWRGWQPANDKQTLDKVFDDYIKPKIDELKNSMGVARWYNNRDVRLEEMPVPRIGSGELLVRVEACGICGTDVMEWYRLDRAPLVLGHEIAGEIVAVGGGVERFKEGDRVAVAHHVPCNTCHYCLNGHHTACDTLRRTNFDPGGFAEYVRLPAINVDRGVFVLPDGLSYEDATFVEPLACVLRGQRKANVQPGNSVLVIGSGIAGLLHVQLARTMGASRVIATDVSHFRLEAAKRFGADAAIPAEAYQPASLRQLNGGRLADRVIICTGATSALSQGLASVERGGTVLIFAPTGPGVTIPLSINELFWRNDVTLTTTYAGSPADYQTALDLISAGAVPVRPMITNRVSLAETGLGFRLVVEAQDSLKVIVEPQR